MHKHQYFEERVARLLDLADEAQEASHRAPDDYLKARYAEIAAQWLKLAEMAVGLGGLSSGRRSAADRCRAGNLQAYADRP